MPNKQALLPHSHRKICAAHIFFRPPLADKLRCPLKWTSNNRVSTKVDRHNKHGAQVSTKVDRYHIIKYVFALCISRSSRIRLNDYSARAQNMCNAHIFKLLIMFRTRNMCSAHIFKVAYMYLLAFICDALTFFAGACSFPNRPFLRTSHIHSA